MSGSDREGPKEACGVFAIASEQAAENTRHGLIALQHRGQESAGICILRDGKCHLHRGMGLVRQVFRELPPGWDVPHDMAIGHVRYSTAGDSSVINAQPFAVELDCWRLSLAHNGNLSNGGVLREHLKRQGAILQGSTDTELILHLAARNHVMGETPWRALQKALSFAEGAYSIVALCEDGMAAVRDPHGFRPLVMGRLDGKIVFASETSAFDMIGAEYEREVEPGEFIHVALDGTTTSSMLPQQARLGHCIFEYIYFARPDSIVFGECVYKVRKRLGAQLAREAPVDADVIMPIPDGGMYAALGYAEESGIPFDLGIMRNHYIGRTFIQPTEDDRRNAVKAKLNPIRDAIRGKRICLIEDSIVRGNTSRERVRTLRECGAKEVHVRISCPPHISPCYYGIDFAEKDQLIANSHTLDEIRELIQVDSLSYLSLEGLLSCVRSHPVGNFCHACFSAEYPIEPQGVVARC
ncbi:MAG TPA: amidophosphoribosyltransferase [Lentisphaeria bacterium]|jgi:amidophosphoribosyltransferase|nr:amidophosphoribosyltransferase [Lentisphaeria bacterium]